MYGLVSILAVYSSVFIEDCMNYFITGVLDRRACKWGKEYAKGGVEYCDNYLNANIALRTLMPNGKGAKLINLRGDSHNKLLRAYKVNPLTIRREECMKILLAMQLIEMQ